MVSTVYYFNASESIDGTPIQKPTEKLSELDLANQRLKVLEELDRYEVRMLKKMAVQSICLDEDEDEEKMIQLRPTPITRIAKPVQPKRFLDEDEDEAEMIHLRPRRASASAFIKRARRAR